MQIQKALILIVFSAVVGCLLGTVAGQQVRKHRVLPRVAATPIIPCMLEVGNLAIQPIATGPDAGQGFQIQTIYSCTTGQSQGCPFTIWVQTWYQDPNTDTWTLTNNVCLFANRLNCGSSQSLDWSWKPPSQTNWQGRKGVYQVLVGICNSQGDCNPAHTYSCVAAVFYCYDTWSFTPVRCTDPPETEPLEYAGEWTD